MISPTFEGDDGDDVWQMRSEHHPVVIYKIHALSLNMQIALMNGHCKATFVNIKLLLY